MQLTQYFQLKRGAGRGAHASRLAVKNNRDLDGKAFLARDLRALRNFNITDRAFGRGHHLKYAVLIVSAVSFVPAPSVASAPR